MMSDLKFFVFCVFSIHLFLIPSSLVTGQLLSASTMVLPDSTIRGTRKHHFDIHDLADVAGGKWKAVHIPDEEISSMLKVVKGQDKNGHEQKAFDIEREKPTKSPTTEGIELPTEVHGRVQAFESNQLRNDSMNSKNKTRPVGNLIVAMENEERGMESHPLYHGDDRLNDLIKLRGKGRLREEEPKTRETLAVGIEDRGGVLESRPKHSWTDLVKLRGEGRIREEDSKTRDSTFSLGNVDRGIESNLLNAVPPTSHRVKSRGEGKIHVEENKKMKETSTFKAHKRPRKPALLVARIPDDDVSSSEDELPLEGSLPSPIVAALRKSPSKVRGGTLRSGMPPEDRRNSQLTGLSRDSSGPWLDSMLFKVKMPFVTSSIKKKLALNKNGASRTEIQSQSQPNGAQVVHFEPRMTSQQDSLDSRLSATTRANGAKVVHFGPRTSLDSRISSTTQLRQFVSPTKSNSTASDEETGVLNKIKSLLLQSHANPATSEDHKQLMGVSKSATKPSGPSTGTPKEAKTAKEVESPPLLLKTTAPNDAQSLSSISMSMLKSTGLLPDTPKMLPQNNAFTNHANALNRISATKKEALLVGIIKALLARGKSAKGGLTINGLANAGSSLPQYDRQAIVQGIQSLQMQKTAAKEGQWNPTGGAMPQSPTNQAESKMNDFYENERQALVREELGRANEESLVATRMRQQEGNILSNYERFTNPESEKTWKGMSPERSETPDGQKISLMGPQQLNVVEDNLTET